MRDKCIAAVTRAAGRALTKAELDGIEARVRAGQVAVSRQDINAWRGMSADQRVMAGAEYARDQLKAEADLAKTRKQLQITKQIQTYDRIQEALFADPDRAHAKRAREKAVVGDIKETFQLTEGIKADAMRGIMGAIDAMKAGQNILARAFDVDNPAMSRDIIREIYRDADGSTGNEIAKNAARQIADGNTTLRKRFNEAGGDVGELSYGYVPIRHAMAKVLGDGSDAARHAWADYVLPRLDRSQYLDANGNPMTDDALRHMLTGDDLAPWQAKNIAAKGRLVAPRDEGVWDTIAHGGVNKIIPGETTGAGARANRGSASRVIHFKDADAHLEYNSQYGEGSLLDALISHVGGISKDIGLVERYGPNPTKNMRTQMQLTAQHDNTELRTLEGGMTSIGAYWNYITGATNSPVNPAMAKGFQTARTTVGAIKLQATLLAALGDVGTVFTTAGYNKVPFFKSLTTAARLALPGGGEFRDWLSSQGLIAESLEHGLNRWGTDNLSTTWAQNLSASTMKFGGVTGWTDALRTGFQAQMMKGLGKLSRTGWDDLTAWDRKALERSGFSAEDWAIVNKAEPGKFGGNSYLTPDGIYGTGEAGARDVVAKMLGMIRDEGEFAVLNPDLTTKVIAAGGSGTIGGELKKTFLQFKSFPIAMLTRHWGRLAEMYRSEDYKLEGAPLMANPLAYGAALTLSTTLMGAISLQAADMLNGKNPENMVNGGWNTAGFWTRAFLKGGGAGFAGDMLNSAITSKDYGDALSAVVGGPLIGTAFQGLHLASSNAMRARDGKDTHVAADAFKFAQSNTPLVNLWYWKTVWNRLLFDNVAENLSPGVTARNMRRSNKQYGNDYFWAPGQSTPNGGPNLAAAIGG